MLEGRAMNSCERGRSTLEDVFQEGESNTVPVPGSKIFTFINMYSCPDWGKKMLLINGIGE